MINKVNKAPPCLLNAWLTHEPELKRYLYQRLADRDDIADLLQDSFVKVWRQGQDFCALHNPRAWLFQVVRNTLIDRRRRQRKHLPLSDDLSLSLPAPLATVDELAQCLPRVLTELSPSDQLALHLCDLDGQPQQQLAKRLGISHAGAKSRIQRARRRLQQQLITACQVRFDAQGHVCCFTPRD